VINKLRRDRFGAQCCPRTHTNPWALVEFGEGFGVSMRQRAPRTVRLVSRNAFIAAPKTYLNGVVPLSVALHERRT